MQRIILPDTLNPSPGRRLAFYLAMEEWAARELPAGDYYFTWIVDSTVIIGRNQDVEAEVDLAYCREQGIDVVRRRSGGGCVFADPGNIMISFITASTHVASTFAHYTALVAAQLRQLGIDAYATGRNDITVGRGPQARKISGNAFYHLPGRSIVHGTMLYSTTPAHMLRAITPSRAKLEAKGVKSVASHIVTASELLPGMGLEQFHRALTCGLSPASTNIVLTEADVAQIEAIEQHYYAPGWLQGRRGRGHEAETHIDGVGQIDCQVSVDADGRIADVDLSGDFFICDDLRANVIEPLRGTEAAPQAVADALQGIDIGRSIQGMTNDVFINLITNALPK